MKRHLVELPVWSIVTVIFLLVIVIWFALVLTSNESAYVVGISSDGRPLHENWKAYSYDGRLVVYTPDWGSRVQVLDNPTAWGLIAFWWPVPASIGIALLTWLAARMPVVGSPLRKKIRIPAVRITLFRVMVVIGTVAAWLWLGRFDLYTRAAGSLIFGFMLHAGFRRSFLAKEAKAESSPATAAGTLLSRAGIAGYSLVVILALSWVVCTLVWESYQLVSF